MKVLFAFILILSLFGLSKSQKQEGTHQIKLYPGNFKYCNVSKLIPDTGATLSVNFDYVFTNFLNSTISQYFNKVDPIWEPKNTSSLLQLDSLIQEIMFNDVNQVGMVYNGYDKTQADAASSYMCSYAFTTDSNKPCTSTCEKALNQTVGFVYDFGNSFQNILPSLASCSAEGSNDTNSCSKISMNQTWTPMEQTVFLFNLEKEDLPFCSYTSDLSGYLYVNLGLPFMQFANNLDTNIFVRKNANYALNQPSYYYNSANRSNANSGWFPIDTSIRTILYEGDNENGFEYYTNSTVKCVPIFATYMCSFAFIHRGQKPCQQICDAFYGANFECPSQFDYKFAAGNVQNVFPITSQCQAISTPDNECSTASFLGYGFDHQGDSLYWEKKTKVEPSDFELRPGGALRGSLLGFGVLIGLLLVIFSLGFIMKTQNRK